MFSEKKHDLNIKWKIDDYIISIFTDHQIRIMEEVLYEGYGPCHVAMLVSCVTDNKNRASSDVKHAFSKYGGSFGGSGSVQWMFDRKSFFVISSDDVARISDKDLFELALMDAGAFDIDDHDGMNIFGPVEAFSALSNVISDHHCEPEQASLMWIPKDTIELSREDESQLQMLIDALDMLDDVSEVFTNI